MKHRPLCIALALVICSVAATAGAEPLPSRTWVSGVGDDLNPCIRTAPCLTFAAALASTAPGGEISVLDPADYGPLTATTSITISGDGTMASIMVDSDEGLTISGAGVVVTIRNLSLIGTGSCAFIGISVADGAVAFVDRVTISGFRTAVETNGGSATLVNSTVTGNTLFGVHAIVGAITVEGSTLAHNGVAVQAEAGATVRLSDNGVYNNQTGFGCGGGVLASAGNNRKGNNVGGGVAACAPTATFTVQ